MSEAAALRARLEIARASYDAAALELATLMRRRRCNAVAYTRAVDRVGFALAELQRARRALIRRI